MNFYNEIDPRAAAWLRELIKAGHIAPGVVDERSIEDIRPDELAQYTQCHFFAGIGVWSYALRRAGWPDDRPVWTGSCPCQPFSTAGKRGGFADERHLWPAFHHLIRECKPPTVFGEQVASKDGLSWLDTVSADMEAEGYAFGAADLCAAGLGAPHTRQRLYFVAHRKYAGLEGRLCGRENPKRESEHGHSGRGCTVDIVADTTDSGCGEKRPLTGWLDTGDCAEGLSAGFVAGIRDLRPGALNGFWQIADWLLCRDGKWRAVESGTRPLAYGAAARVGRLRGYGNAIVAPCAEAFITASMECLPK